VAGGYLWRLEYVEPRSCFANGMAIWEDLHYGVIPKRTNVNSAGAVGGGIGGGIAFATFRRRRQLEA